MAARLLTGLMVALCLVACRVVEQVLATSAMVSRHLHTDALDRACAAGLADDAGVGCPVTRFDPWATLLKDGVFWNYGRDGLWTNIPPEGTRFIAGAGVQADGSLSDKWPWWHEGAAEGTLTVTGRRLDVAAPPLRAWYLDGYGASGVQAGGLTFPTVGCWEVTG